MQHSLRSTLVYCFPSQSEEFVLVQPLLKKYIGILNGFPSCWSGDNKKGATGRPMSFYHVTYINSLLTEGKIQHIAVLGMWGLTKIMFQLLNTTVT